MTGPTNNHEHAFVPEYLTAMTIDILPLGKVFYITPGERDDHDQPTVFVTPDRRLVMSKSEPIDMDDQWPMVPLERVGVMHEIVTDPQTGMPRDAYFADLRFIVDNALVDIDLSTMQIEDQESYMAMVDALNDTVTFDGFIATEPGFEIDDYKVPGTYFGNPEHYPHLDKMRKRGNKHMKHFMHLEAKPQIIKPSAAAKPEETKPVSPKKQKDPAYLDDPFRQPGQ